MISKRKKALRIKKNKNSFFTTNILVNPQPMSFAGVVTSQSLLFAVFDKNNKTIFKISDEGEIFYRYNDEMIKIDCPEDLSQAFQECVLFMTSQNYEDLMIEKYIEKILNHKKSNEYITKLEKAFRKLKLEKLNQNK